MNIKGKVVKSAEGFTAVVEARTEHPLQTPPEQLEFFVGIGHGETRSEAMNEAMMALVEEMEKEE